MNSDFCVAVHALVYLKHMDRQLSSEALADNICTNPARIRKVMAKLKPTGWIMTREGAVGGYRLNPETGEITLKQVAEALDTAFVEINWRSGAQDKSCLISSGMAGVLDNLLDDLNGMCRERLANRSISQIERELLSRK